MFRDTAIRIVVDQPCRILNETRVFDVNGQEIEVDEVAVQAKLAELIAAEPLRLLRIQRDQLLSATDWWVLPDRTPTQAQLAYRQALRDLPSTATPALDEDGNLTGVTWPTKPE